MLDTLDTQKIKTGFWNLFKELSNKKQFAKIPTRDYGDKTEDELEKLLKNIPRGIFIKHDKKILSEREKEEVYII